MILKRTKSMCPKCYREVVATISTSDKVYITQHCPVHGDSTGVLEPDVGFYMELNRRPSCIYDGHLVDVTTRCNLNCKYCFYEKGSTDISLPEIINECMLNRGPYILTGGEPTMRQDLPDVLHAVSGIGQVLFLTNGTGLLDKQYLRECAATVSCVNGVYGIGLSYHAEFDRFDDVVENIKSVGVKINSVFFVIDELPQIDRAIQFARDNKGLVETIRVKTSSNLWAEHKVGEKLYVSQVLKYFERKGPVIVSENSKPVYTPFMFEGQRYAAISWHDVTNVDLDSIDCPPTYRAKTGQVTDFVHATLINESLQ